MRAAARYVGTRRHYVLGSIYPEYSGNECLIQSPLTVYRRELFGISGQRQTVGNVYQGRGLDLPIFRYEGSA